MQLLVYSFFNAGELGDFMKNTIKQMSIFFAFFMPALLANESKGLAQSSSGGPVQVQYEELPLAEAEAYLLENSSNRSGLKRLMGSTTIELYADPLGKRVPKNDFEKWENEPQLLTMQHIIALDFEKNFVRHELVCSEWTETGNPRQYAVERRLRLSKDADYIQVANFDGKLDGKLRFELHPFYDRVQSKRRMVLPNVIDPYLMPSSTVFFLWYRTASGLMHESVIDASIVPKLEEIESAFSLSDGTVVLRKKLSQDIGAEFRLDPSKGSMIIATTAFLVEKKHMKNGVEPEDYWKTPGEIDTKLQFDKIATDWKKVGEVWLPSRIEGTYKIRGLHYEAIFDCHKWWIDGEVPDSVFTYDDISASEIGKSIVNEMVRKLREAKQ